MRYEDASQSGSSISENPVARDDADALPAGDRGPATGNVISGSGTQTGAAGADLNAEAAHIVSINGAHGSDSSFTGGKLVADGQFGRISIDREGNYSYLANKGAPESSRDSFTYKLADVRGHADSATLTIEIGKTPTVVQANAQRVVPGPDGVVVLPAGVELSDIHVVGRNLVIDLPDGRQMLIIDGAVFVPQLVLGDVEVPATSLAALLIGSELRPAAGPEGDQPLSGGGNFEVPVGPLDPGVPLGDLIPPTELAYVPPDFRESNIVEDDEPEILIQTPDQPAGAVDASARVFEEALPARAGEPSGSNSASTAETTTGTIVYESNDTPNTLTVNGVVIVAIGQVINGTYGAITITSIADGAIGYSYTLADNTIGDATSDLFTVVITDSDGDTDTATLTVSIVDDVPTARADADSVREDGPLVADGNVLSGSGGTDANATDGVADTPGADGITITGIAFGSTAGAVGSPLAGAYGSLVLGANGNYVYTLNNQSGTVQALGVNESLTETFTYTITDGDGDVRSTTLTITINGTNDVPTIVAGAAVVSEEGLAAGNPDTTGVPTDSTNSATAPGQLTIGDVDGDSLTVILGIPAGSLTSHGQPVTWSLSSDGHVLTGSAGGAAVITVTVANNGSYSIALLGQVDHPNAGGEDILPISVPVTLNDGTVSVSSTLTVSVEDDSPRITTAPAVTSSVLIDETAGASPLSSGAPLVVTSVGAIITTGVSLGADGPGTATAYSLSLQGGGTSIASGLQTALGDQPITLTATSATLITATYNGGTQTAFTIQMNADGSITVTQFTALEHLVDGSTAAAYDDALNLVIGDVSLVNAVATYTDFDGDRVTATTGIGGAITFRDDGPSIDVTANAAVEAAVLLTTGDDGTEGAGSTSASTTSGNFGGAFGLTFDVGADGAASPSLAFTLNATTAVSGLTSHGVAINLYNVGGVIVGSTAGTAPASATDASVVFAVSVGATGIVTLTQYAQIDHPLEAGSNNAPFADQLATLADGAITLTASSTIVDNDGDSASDSATINIGANLRFADDGPDIIATLNQGATIRVDETDGVAAAGGEVDPLGGNLGTVTVAAASLFTVSTVSPSADAPTTLAYALAISAPGVASGLLLSTTNEAIVLVNNGGVIEGHVGTPAGAIAFTVSIDAASGATTLTQFLAVEHFDPSSPDEDSSGLTAGVLSVVVSATDYDGDTDVASADLGSIIRFEDDGPIAVDDNDSIASGAYGPATGNVITDAALGDAGDGDTGRDNVGADNASVVGVAVGGADVPLVNAGTVGAVVQGTYGQLTLNADGSYSYVRDAGTPGGVSDVFTYTLRDGDGDFATAQLTITIGDSGTSLDVPTQGEAGTLVDEAGLPTRNGTEPAGTGEAADLNGTNDSDQSERTAGVISFTAPDGPAIVTIDGTVVTGTIGQTFAGSFGVLTITGYNAGTGVINYSYVLGDNTSGNTTFDDFVVRVTDQDGDFTQSTLVIDIVDDEPLAVDDTDSIASGSFVPATGNVITDAALGDAGDSDTGRDNVGADNASVVGVAVGGADVPLVNAGTVGAVVQGTYGQLTLNADGSYSYVRDAGTPGGVSDVFTYTLRDGDGDFATAQLTITIGDSGTSLDVPTQGEAGTLVDEAGLPTRNGTEPAGTGEAADLNGTNDSDQSERTAGVISFTAPDGPAIVTIDGTVVTGTIGQTFAGSFGVLTITGYNAGTGVINYSYVLGDNTSGNTTFDDFVVRVTDQDGDFTQSTLVIDIVDDEPLAVDDTDSIASGSFVPATGNVITDAALGDAGDSDTGRDNVGADNASVVGVAVGGADVPLVNAGTVGAVVQGTYGQLTLNADGSYSYVRDAGTPGGVSDVFTYTLRDGDGDFATAQLTITIGDSGTSLDVPTQGEAGTLVDEAGLPTRNGTEPAGTGEAADLNGTNDSDQSERTAGVISFTAPDGPAIVTIDGTVVTGTIGQTFAGSFGVLTITGYNAGTGVINYSYVLGDNTSGNTTFDDFVVRVTDQDGDFTQSTLVIDIVDDEPLAVDDTDSIASGSFVPATGNVITDAALGDAGDSDTGRDNVGADNASVVGVAVGGADVPLVNAGTVGAVVQGTYGQLTLNADGSYSYVRDAGTPGGVSDQFTYTLRDGDGDFATAQLTITIGDATPQANTPAPVWLDDDALTNGNPGGVGDRSPDLQNTTGTLTGTGGDGDLDFFFSASQTLPAGYSVDPTSTATTLRILQGTTVVITVTLDNETGAYTVTQNAPIMHATGLNENDSPDFNISFFTRDVDGSVSAPANLTISVDDDSARITAASNINIQNSGDVAATGTFAFSLGADGAPSNNDVFSAVTGSATVNGVPVTNYLISQTSETAAGAVFSFSFDYAAGPTTVHETGTLTFDVNTGTYTVDLANPISGITLTDTASAPASAFVNYNTNGTTSNGPSEIATVQLAPNLFIQFTGDAEPGSGTGSDNLTTTQGTGGTFTPTVGTFGNLELFAQAAATVTVSSSAAGVAGNTIQGGEVLDFNLYANNPFGNTSGVPTASATSMYIQLDGIGGAEDFILVLKLYDTVTGTYTTQALMVQNGDIITSNTTLAGTIYSGLVLDSNDGLVVIEANDYQNGNANLVIVGAQIAGSDEGIIGLATNFNGTLGAAGGSSALNTQAFSTDVSDAPFKIQNIGFITQSTTAQTAQLTFNVTVQDSDGDTATQTLVASVTANPDSSTPLVVTPVALDTNHDGVISYLSTDAGVTFDYAGDGSAESTAWIGAGDSILVRDADGNGTVSGASEFVFGNFGQTDLQALHAQYGEQLDASDADFVQFMVWNDANSNGIADAGELTSLTDAGIVSLSLVSDGVVASAADGDVAIAGSGSFTYVNDNGETREGRLADVAFRTVGREIEQAQRISSASGSAAIVTAAVAAVGLAATQAAAHGHDQPVSSLEVAAQSGLGAGPADLAIRVDVQSNGQSLLGTEERLAAHEPLSTSHGLAQPLSHDLTLSVGHGHDIQDMAGLLAPSESLAQDALSASPMAAMIVIPLIEGFAAADAAHDVGAQRAGAIENVLAEALDGGAGGGDIDAILASLPNLGGGNPALEALASQHGAGVSGWDMGPDAHLSASLITNIVVDMTTFHHDAVQPVING